MSTDASPPSLTSKCIVVSLPHHLDHVVPISYYLNIPLVARNFDTEEALLTFYPQVPFYSMKEADFLKDVDEILCTSVGETTLRDFHEAIYQKKPKITRLHHGYSDKIQDFSRYDHIINYKDFPNYRLRFYLEFREMMLKKAREYLPFENPLLITLSWDRPNVEEQLHTLCKHPQKGQFLFRLHPLLVFNDVLDIKLQAFHNIHLLPTSCPYIYPFLELCSGVLTDCSSIGYDLLYFEKPLFVLEEIPLKKFSSKNLDSWIEESLNGTYKKGHKEAYFDIFGVS